jgi:hypothetical protein
VPWGAGLGISLAGLTRVELLRAVDNALPEPAAGKLPRWHGFNLLEKFSGRGRRFNERHFEWIGGFGFNFVRLPMDYRMWIEDNDWTKFHEPALKEIDEAVKFGEKHGVHVCLDFQCAPALHGCAAAGRKIGLVR